jgi:hypothetical protein
LCASVGVVNTVFLVFCLASNWTGVWVAPLGSPIPQHQRVTGAGRAEWPMNHRFGSASLVYPLLVLGFIR